MSRRDGAPRVGGEVSNHVSLKERFGQASSSVRPHNMQALGRHWQIVSSGIDGNAPIRLVFSVQMPLKWPSTSLHPARSTTTFALH
jgi:hypothetical protein